MVCGALDKKAMWFVVPLTKRQCDLTIPVCLSPICGDDVSVCVTMSCKMTLSSFAANPYSVHLEADFQHLNDLQIDEVS